MTPVEGWITARKMLLLMCIIYLLMKTSRATLDVDKNPAASSGFAEVLVQFFEICS
jgi:hypothetical protein